MALSGHHRERWGVDRSFRYKREAGLGHKYTSLDQVSDVAHGPLVVCLLFCTVVLLFAPLIIIYFIQFIHYDDDDDNLILSLTSFQYMLYIYLFDTILVQLIINEYFHYIPNY